MNTSCVCLCRLFSVSVFERVDLNTTTFDCFSPRTHFSLSLSLLTKRPICIFQHFLSFSSSLINSFAYSVIYNHLLCFASFLSFDSSSCFDHLLNSLDNQPILFCFVLTCFINKLNFQFHFSLYTFTNNKYCIITCVL